MTDINLQLTREFFELHYFRVLTPWQHPRGSGTDGARLYVDRTGPSSGDDVGPILNGGSIRALHRAVVEVRAWHSERFYASVIESNPVLYQFAREDLPAADLFAGEPYRTVLVISELPVLEHARAEAIAALQRHGVQHVLEFPTLLQSMLERITTNTDYGGSTTLQLLQLIKRYRLARNSQLEFRFPMEPSIAPSERTIETVDTPNEDDPSDD